MSDFKKVTLNGPFTKEDVTLLMEAVRYCEKKQPDKTFLVQMDPETEQTVADAKQFIEDSFPAVKGIPVETTVMEMGKENKFDALLDMVGGRDGIIRCLNVGNSAPLDVIIMTAKEVIGELENKIELNSLNREYHDKLKHIPTGI